MSVTRRRPTRLTVLTAAASIWTATALLANPAAAATGTLQPGLAYNGDATYYGANAGGACGFGGYTPPNLVGMLPVAIDTADYQDGDVSRACGAVLLIAGTGTGSGATPVSAKPFFGYVADLCAYCASHSLDLAVAGDGKWGITWRVVNATGAKPLMYQFTGSSLIYIDLLVSNYNNLLAKVEIRNTLTGLYVPMIRTSDNHWVVPAGLLFGNPISLRLTDIYGDRITQSALPIINNIQQTGNTQFPARP